MKIKEGTFVEALILSVNDSAKSKKYLKDKRLTQSEKKILQCWIDLRGGKYNKIIKTLDDINGDLSEAIEGHYYLISGLVHISLSNYLKANNFLEKTRYFESKMGGNLFSYLIYYNLFINSANCHDLNKMKDCLNLIVPYCHTQHQKNMKLMMEAVYLLKQDLIPAARVKLDELKENKEDLLSTQRHNYYFYEFLYFSKVEKWNQCRLIINELKKIRQYRITPNYIYMKTLLDYLSENKPIYAYANKYKGAPNLFLEIETLKYLESGDFDSAQASWQSLQNMSPLRYQDNFIYSGDKCVFSICLEGLLSGNQKLEITIDLPADRAEALIVIIQKSKSPVSKDILFKKLWSREASSVKDDKLLENTLYKARKLLSEEKIKYRKGCYFIEKKAS